MESHVEKLGKTTQSDENVCKTCASPEPPTRRRGGGSLPKIIASSTSSGLTKPGRMNYLNMNWDVGGRGSHPPPASPVARAAVDPKGSAPARRAWARRAGAGHSADVVSVVSLSALGEEPSNLKISKITHTVGVNNRAALRPPGARQHVPGACAGEARFPTNDQFLDVANEDVAKKRCAH